MPQYKFDLYKKMNKSSNTPGDNLFFDEAMNQIRYY